jgi:hypothetical protein
VERTQADFERLEREVGRLFGLLVVYERTIQELQSQLAASQDALQKQTADEGATYS